MGTSRIRTLRPAAGAAVVLTAVALLAAGSARAHAVETGVVVVRLVTDPAPAGVSWSYSGIGDAFQLGVGAAEKTLPAVEAGTYRLTETTGAGQPATLTALDCSDPSRDTRVQRAAGTATVAVAAGETVACTFTHRALGPRPAASAVELAARFAPTLRLAVGERYRPLRIEDYLAHATLRSGTPPRGASTLRHPTLFALPVTPGASYLDVETAEPYSHAVRYAAIEQQIERAQPRPTVYWRTLRQPSTGRVAIEYWFLYLYNAFLDRHEADWEGVTVFLQDGAPLGASYSQHQGRTWVPWPAATTGESPAVYVAAGSHADYPLAGRYPVRVCWTFHGRRCTVTKQSDDARGTGVTLTPTAYDLHELGGAGYTGGFGSGNYVLGFGLAKDRISDPRRRAEYSNPFAAVPAHPRS